MKGRNGCIFKIICLTLLVFSGMLWPRPVRAAEEAEEDHTAQMLLDQDGMLIEYFQVLSYSSGARTDMFHIVNGSREARIIELTDFIVNEKIRPDLRIWTHLEAGEEDYYTSDELTEFLVLTEETGNEPASYAVQARVYYWESGSNEEEILRFSRKCRADLVPPEALRYHCIPAMDMLAEEQVLSAEDGHEIRLLGCGNYLGCSESYPVSGILCIDNRTDEVLPYGVFSAKVNGITVDLYKSGYDSDNLPPGTKRFMKFYLPADDLEKASITSIADFEIQVLTSAEENTGTFRTEGGKWYPVKLARHGSISAAYNPGTIIYEDEYVEIGYRGGNVEWHEYTMSDSSGSCIWNLSFRSKSDMTIELDLLDLALTDAAEEEPAHKPYIFSPVIAPGATRYEAIQMMIEEEIPLPAISFKVRVLKQGGGTLLHESESPIVINP